MKKLLNILLASCLLYAVTGFIASCSEEADCSGTTRPMMQCNLYKLNAESGEVEKDTLETVTVTAAVTDSVIVNRQQSVKEFSLPLQYTADSTKLVFHYSDVLRDTLVVFHTNTPYFLSMDCGYQMKQSITSVRYTRNVLDSISIRSKEASIYGTENLKLFY